MSTTNEGEENRNINIELGVPISSSSFTSSSSDAMKMKNKKNPFGEEKNQSFPEMVMHFLTKTIYTYDTRCERRAP